MINISFIAFIFLSFFYMEENSLYKKLRLLKTHFSYKTNQEILSFTVWMSVSLGLSSWRCKKVELAKCCHGQEIFIIMIAGDLGSGNNFSLKNLSLSMVIFLKCHYYAFGSNKNVRGTHRSNNSSTFPFCRIVQWLVQLLNLSFIFFFSGKCICWVSFALKHLSLFENTLVSLTILVCLYIYWGISKLESIFKCSNLYTCIKNRHNSCVLLFSNCKQIC